MKVVIVGGVAAGASAAARIRRLDEKAQIIIFERSGFISYANCGLPYYVGGTITDRDELTLQTPESFWERFRIDARVRHEVTEINAAEKNVTVRRLDTGKTYRESYDKLLLATGAKPARTGIPGAGEDRVFTLRTVEDAFRIREFAENAKPRTAAVIGGGFIGLEMAENLTGLGVRVTIVEYSDHLLAPFDKDMAAQLHTLFKSCGVGLMLGEAVTGFEQKDGGIAVKTSGGAEIECDMAVLAAGVVPDTSLAAGAGIKTGVKGGIIVNERMETSVPDIYAAGDAVVVKNFVMGEDALIPLAGPANRQGRTAADNICGGNSVYKGSLGSSVIKLFDMTAAATGINEAAAKAAGIDYDRVVLSPSSHASYYPGGQVMTLKVIFEKGTERLLGAQITGRDGVDKRIDVIAAAIRAGLKATELGGLELAYAPPYSSAKDPVNLAGFMIENLVTGKVKQFHYDEIDVLCKENAFLLDARTEGEYSRGHADGFINIPLDDLRERMEEIPRDKPVYVMCQSGLRSYIACRILAQNGYDCYNFSGGYRFYNMINSGKAQSESAYPCGIEK